MSAILTSFRNITKGKLNLKELDHFLKFALSQTKRVPLKAFEKELIDSVTNIKKKAAEKGISVFEIDASNFLSGLSGLGKITDTTDVVPGGAADAYWGAVMPKNFTGEGKIIKDKKYFDPETVKKRFNLKSIEFGNWMNEKDKISFLYAFSRSMEIYSILNGINLKDVGFSEKLSVAFGARGVPNASAHYQPVPTHLINLTKKKGHHSLVHEYGHALDNQLSKKAGVTDYMLTGGKSERKRTDLNKIKSSNILVSLMEQVFHTMFWDKNNKETDFQLRHQKLTDYYNYRAEIWARLIEVYTYYQLKDKGIVNKFLVKPVYGGAMYATKKEIETVKPLIKQLIDFAYSKGQLPKNKVSAKQLQLFGVGDVGFASTIIQGAKTVASTVAAVKTAKGLLSTLPDDLREIASPIGAKEKKSEYFDLKGEISSFFGKLEKKPKGSIVITLDGSAGSGKTRFFFQVVNELILNGLKGALITLEEHKYSSLVTEKEKEYLPGENGNNYVKISELPNGFDSIKSLLNYCDFVVIDSWGKVPNGYNRLDELRNSVDGKLIFVIYQQTTDGRMRGGSSSAFDADIVLKTAVFDDYRKNYIYAVKNRYQDKPLTELAYSIYDKKTFNPSKSSENDR